MPQNSILQVSNLTKTYKSGESSLTVLRNVSFEVNRGASCAIVGPSGSGKTTLLGLCAGLDNPSEGSVMLNGIVLDKLSEDEKAKVRNQHVGFIFQNFNLLPTLTALENVMIPLELQNRSHPRKRAMELLEKVGLGDRVKHYPAQLSGGEQQRVSIARAFANEPAILFADEPTGNLDGETGATIESLILELNKTAGTTLIMVTHDLDLAKRTDRVITMKNGKVYTDSLRPLQTQ
ncbi:ABC transporter ATP-binding protein [Cryomorpha ignava]|uniref:ABC transporter ATP-binding protein n=1 Tax=Cryomorpha ignava TaxID=101383 RepID=A0A7K3WKC6_9FLAO|nr:ABC transporter ATP-binding protein [Cryomorpha ignava]NEN21944.1 ABC transporter ATP-binding protein [Cryomorpha ignava]